MNTLFLNQEKLFESCLKKQEKLIHFFSEFSSTEEKYRQLIEWGRLLPPMPLEFKTDENIVQGCQSIVYLHSSFKEGKVFFQASSEALISSGLANLLLSVYNEEPPEVVLKCPPSFLDTLGIHTSLTPGRSNGLFSMHLRMKQDALKILVNNQN